MSDPLKRAADDAARLFRPFAEEAQSSNASLEMFGHAIREARAGALELVGEGRPESVWARYEKDTGPLAEIDHASVIDLLWYQLQWAGLRDESTLLIPPVIARYMLDDLKARRDSRSIRPAHRPRRSQLSLRYQSYAVSQVRVRKHALIQAGESRADALETALTEIGRAHGVSRETVRTWMKNPARLRPRK